MKIKFRFLTKRRSPIKHRQKGQTLVEVLVSTALLMILIPAVFTVVFTTREGKVQREKRSGATAMIKATEEITRLVRERGWSLFANNGSFYPVVDSDSWLLVAGTETIDDFTREIIISDVYRDVLGNIAVSGSLDPSTKKVVTKVSWSYPFFSEISSTAYLTRYLDNIVFTDTTEVDFDAGEFDSTVVINNEGGVDGGEVILGTGGQGSWCDPNESIVMEMDLPKQGVAQAISAVEGRLVAGTGENASGVAMAEVSITNTNPPTGQITDQIDGYKTNDVFTESSYAYIATDTTQKEVVITDLNASPLSEIGFVNLPGSTDAQGVVASGNVGYVVQSSKFWSFDLSSKTGERSLLDGDGVDLAGVAKEFIVVGSYAYIAMDGDVELQIVDVGNPSNLQIVAWANVDAANGRDVSVNEEGSRAYLVTEDSDTQDEFFVIDISSKSGNRSVLGSYDSQGMNPKAVGIVLGNNVIMVGHDAEEYQVISISNESNPIRCGGLQLDVGINDIATVLEGDGDAYSYILTKDSNLELKVIEGGPGGQYSSEGTFTSSVFDSNYATVFNRLDFDATITVGTTLEYQVSVMDAVGGSCDGLTHDYWGPDKTSASFFDAASALPWDDDGSGYENPGQCFRYKFYFSTENSGQTPILEEVRVNYSP